jgi:ubiquinone/menaquinone biosynthesis C-methylase UbiE
MRELSKSIWRRAKDPIFVNSIFVGNAIDIGGEPDPLSLYAHMFPKLGDVKVWDLSDGDAQKISSFTTETFDLVHSSHCLEHMVDPLSALVEWYTILKPGGYLVVTVPDEDLYEQGIFPSTFNFDHKWTFTIFKNDSWSNKSLNVLDLTASLSKELGAEIHKISLEKSGYIGNLPRFDQSLIPTVELSIEMIIHKPGATSEIVQPDESVRKIMNQLKKDFKGMKSINAVEKPFQDISDI